MAKNNNQTENDLISLVNKLLIEGIKSRASDIHLDPERNTLNIRFRIDGLLYLMGEVDKYQEEKLISRIKVLSGLDISEHQMPKDGHMEFDYNGKAYNIRVTTSPTTNGESATLRILDREDILVKMENLGLDQEQFATTTNLVNSSYGLVIITGPTNSGKSTFLYSIISTFNNSEKSIITIEDPVEYNMAGIRQIQTRDVLGLDFAKAMHSIARQDPNIIMVGEMRDPETAQMVFQASLSGALVLTTFHTFDIPGLVIRIVEIGIPRSVIAHSIRGVISTRLIRKICPNCKVEYKLNEHEKKVLGTNYSGGTFYKGQGCSNCRNSGYLGRIGLFSITPFDDEIKFNIIEDRGIASLKELLVVKKIKDLWDSAMNKILDGTTTVEEAIRILGYPAKHQE